jgi:hypothetical protein
VLLVMEAGMLSQASRVGRVSWKTTEGMFTRVGGEAYGRPMAGLGVSGE